jgi:hypothetical protein
MTTQEYRDLYPEAILYPELSEETKEKLREFNTGNVLSEETRRKISESLEGHVVTEETRQLISEGNTGRVKSDEERQRISEANTGHVHSEEHKQRISVSCLEFFASEEGTLARQKMSDAHTGMVASEESRQRQSESLREFYASEEGQENRQRQADSIREFWATEEGILSKKRGSDSLRAYYASEEGKVSLARGASRRLLKIAESNPSLFPYLSKGERYVHGHLEESFPDQYEYTGNGSFHIGSKNPDFKHTSKMKVIEFYGSSNYHGHYLGEEEERSREFAEHGYEVLFIRGWEIDLKERDFEKVVRLLNKIGRFTYN